MAYPDIPQSQTRQPTNFVRRLILALILLFVTISTVSVVAWLVLHPKTPIFRLNSLSLSNFTLLNSQAKANYVIDLTIRNPNEKIGLSLDEFEIYVLYRKIKLLRASIPSLKVEKMGRTRWRYELGIERVYSVHDTVLKNIKWDLDKKVVSLDLKIQVRTRFSAGDWACKRKLMEFYCGSLNIGFLPGNYTGKLIGGGKDCIFN